MIHHNDRNIKEVLSEMISGNKKIAKGYNTVRIQEVWKEEMGDIIVSYTEKIWLKDGKLFVQLSSAPLRNELTMGKAKVIDILNTALGQSIVNDVIFR